MVLLLFGLRVISLQLVFQQCWTGLLKDWLQLVATSLVASCLVLRNLATSPVASCLKFGQKDWTGLDFKTLAVAHPSSPSSIIPTR